MKLTKYMPLKIPMGWAVTYNNTFADVEPIIIEGKIKNWSFFKEHLLHITSLKLDSNGYTIINREGYSLDLGWYPDGDPHGTYKLYVLKGDWSNKFYYLESKNRYQIQKAINIILDLIKNHPIKEEDLERTINQWLLK